MEETKSNLEPIEESDLDTKDKFIGGANAEKPMPTTPETKEIPKVMEQQVERKEGAAEKESSYAKILSKIPVTQPQATRDEEIASDAAATSQEMDVESKIKNLVNIAETKGIAHAVKVARHMEDNYTLDEFHDRLLADELHDALVRKGIIKEI